MTVFSMGGHDLVELGDGREMEELIDKEPDALTFAVLFVQYFNMLMNLTDPGIRIQRVSGMPFSFFFLYTEDHHRAKRARLCLSFGFSVISPALINALRVISGPASS